jgi:hypothetical protein
MDNATLMFIVSAAGAVISVLVLIIVGMVAWFYQHDGSEKSRRIEFLERQVLDFKEGWMGRNETQGLVGRIEQEFVGKHENLSENVAGIVGSVSELRVLFEHQQLVWTTQLHDLGKELNKTVAEQIGICSKALMDRVKEQFEAIHREAGKSI